jgi:hypothetical protein
MTHSSLMLFVLLGAAALAQEPTPPAKPTEPDAPVQPSPIVEAKAPAKRATADESLVPPTPSELKDLVIWYGETRQRLGKELAAYQAAGDVSGASATLVRLDTARRNVLAAYEKLKGSAP